MSKRNLRKRRGIVKRLEVFWHEIKQNKVKAFVNISLNILVVIVLIAEFFNKNYNNFFLCILTLILFMIPSFINKRLHIVLPGTLEIIILLFIFSAEILGEINEYYLIFDHWDDILHTINGFLCAAIGFSLIDILNRNQRISFSLSPIFVSLMAFCFSMTIGVLWEFFEFGMDIIFKTDMQKDTILPTISSVVLNPDGRNVAVLLPIDSIVVNGTTWEYGGYIDIGLFDTMRDLFVNFIGAVTFSTIGYFYISHRGQGNFVKRFIPRRKTEKEMSEKEEE